MITLVLKTIWLLLPAYTPNNFAVLFGGGKPIDLNKNFIDGRRIFGDGKTIRGFVAGVIGGIIVANLQLIIERSFGFEVYSSVAHVYIRFLLLVFLLSFGSMTGDLFGSFVKRRLGFERGRSLPVLDQLMFLVFAYAFASALDEFHMLFTMDILITGVIITPALHLLVNVMAYKLKLKDVWW